MEKVSVITGDIIKFSRIKEKELFYDILKDIFIEIEEKILNYRCFQISRGDSFQGKIINVGDVLRTAILIRAGLRSRTSRFRDIKERNDRIHRFPTIPIKLLWDARISVGIGDIDFDKENISESGGIAFNLSGRQLDRMKKGENISIVTTDENINRELFVIIKLIDSIISKWSIFSSSIAYEYLLNKRKQSEFAEYLGISQSAISQRLDSANIEAIEIAIDYLNERVLK